MTKDPMIPFIVILISLGVMFTLIGFTLYGATIHIMALWCGIGIMVRPIGRPRCREIVMIHSRA